MKLKLSTEVVLSKETSTDRFTYKLVKEVDNVSENHLKDDDIATKFSYAIEKALRKHIELIFNNDNIILDESDVSIVPIMNDRYNEKEDTLIIDNTLLIKFKTESSENKDELERMYHEFINISMSVLNFIISQYLTNFK